MKEQSYEDQDESRLDGGMDNINHIREQAMKKCQCNHKHDIGEKDKDRNCRS